MNPQDDRLKTWAESWGNPGGIPLPEHVPSEIERLRAEVAALYRRLAIVEKALEGYRDDGA